MTDPNKAPPRLAQMIGTLAFAGDLSMGQPVDHSPRTALLARALCRALGLDADTTATAQLLALLRWSGCTANAREFSDLFGDDVAGRAALISGRNPFVARQPPVGLPLGGLIAPLSEMHCATVATLAGRLPLAAPLRQGIEDAAPDFFEQWDGSGYPAAKRGEEISLTAQIVTICGDLEVWGRIYGTTKALALVEAGADIRSDPGLVRQVLAHGAAWLTEAAAGDAWARCLADLPAAASAFDLDAAVTLLGDYADLKTPARVGEARKAGKIAGHAAAIAGLDAVASTHLERAAMLHGLGQVAVPNAVLDMSAPSEADREQIRLIPYLTERALSRFPDLAAEARLASFAFERLDGSGYHRGLRGTEIGLDARLLQCCVALARGENDTAGLDADALARAQVAARADGAPRRAAAQVMDARPSVTARETEVLALLVTGLSNKEIARDLQIAPRTVGTHVESLYRKLDVTNRATATLKALELRLIEP